MCGHLTKQGKNVLGDWRKRWCILRTDHMYYYKSESVRILLMPQPMSDFEAKLFGYLAGHINAEADGRNQYAGRVSETRHSS